MNTSYKLLTALLASHLGALATRQRVLPDEQVVIRKGVWGCTHAMLIDQAVIADAFNQKQRPLHVAWIDYAKAFDSVPHAYLIWLLQCMRVDEATFAFISNLFDAWTVRYECRDARATLKSAPLAIRSGVLQGDSFSPLLFCLAMAPLSHAINKLELGYVSGSGGKALADKFAVSHLFYMDDLKLYSQSARSLDTVLNKVASLSRSISMQVNVAKCARASHEPNLCNAEGCNSTESPTSIKELAIGESYKYLGIEQKLGIKPSLAWDRAKAKFSAAIEKVWQLDLNFHQKVSCTNAAALAMTYVTRNSFKGTGKFGSTLKRAAELDVHVRKTLVRVTRPALSIGSTYQRALVDGD